MFWSTFISLQKKLEEFKFKFERYSLRVNSSNLASLVKIPMMLTACCCMWYEEDCHSGNPNDGEDYCSIDSPSAHTSMTYTYLSLVDSMIRRADEKHDLKSLVTQALPATETHLPKVPDNVSIY